MQPFSVEEKSLRFSLDLTAPLFMRAMIDRVEEPLCYACLFMTLGSGHTPAPNIIIGAHKKRRSSCAVVAEAVPVEATVELTDSAPAAMAKAANDCAAICANRVPHICNS